MWGASFRWLKPIKQTAVSFQCIKNLSHTAAATIDTDGGARNGDAANLSLHLNLELCSVEAGQPLGLWRTEKATAGCIQFAEFEFLPVLRPVWVVCDLISGADYREQLVSVLRWRVFKDRNSCLEVVTSVSARLWQIFFKLKKQILYWSRLSNTRPNLQGKYFCYP